MIGSFCTTLLLHFSKRFSTANIHFSIKIALMILHFFYLPVSTLYQPGKVDTEKIFQLNIFSKVDNRDIFVRFDFTKVDILYNFTSFSFPEVDTLPKLLSGSTVARLSCTNLGSVVNSLFSNVPLHFISPLLYRFL